MLGLLGLPILEATSANAADHDEEHGHRMTSGDMSWLAATGQCIHAGRVRRTSMAYGHAERNLATIRRLEAETSQLADSPAQLDQEQPAGTPEIASPAQPKEQERRSSWPQPSQPPAGSVGCEGCA
jgi:hypothetical protein